MKQKDKLLKGKFSIYILCFWKKIRDSKIRTKLIVYLTLVTVVCSLTVGSVSYIVMRSALVDNAKDSAISLLKQVGFRMDERILDFQNATYSLGQKEEILNILKGNTEESNQLNHIRNQSLINSNLLLFNSIYKYSYSVMMESEEGEFYLYNKAGGNEKISIDTSKELLGKFRNKVSDKNTMKWILDGERIYFVRKVTQMDNKGKIQSAGIMVFAVSESFFIAEKKEAVTYVMIILWWLPRRV